MLGFIETDTHYYPVAINLLSAFLYFLIGAVGYLISGQIWRLRRSAFHKFSGYPRGLKKVHLVYGLVQTNKKKSRYTVEEGDVTSLCSALLLLEENFGVNRVDVGSCHSVTNSLGDLKNIVSISGPVWNSVTKRIMDQLNLPFQFAEINGEDALVIDGDGEPKTTIYEDDVARVCYGVVLRTLIEGGDGQKQGHHAVVAAGVSALGTYGATVWLRRLSRRRSNKTDLWRNARLDEPIAVILRIEDKSPSGFRAFASGPTKPAFLDVEIVDQFRI